MAKTNGDPDVLTTEKNEAHTPPESVDASEDVDFVVENVRARVSTPVVRISSKRVAQPVAYQH